MNKRAVIVAALLICAPTIAMAAGRPLECAQNERTFEVMCFAKNGVRSNGEVRAAKLWKGGPKNIVETSFTARVHCGSRVLELTDRNGVAFQRNVPGTQLGKDFVQFLCGHSPTKRDPKLNVN